MKNGENKRNRGFIQKNLKLFNGHLNQIYKLN